MGCGLNGSMTNSLLNRLPFKPRPKRQTAAFARGDAKKGTESGQTLFETSASSGFCTAVGFELQSDAFLPRERGDADPRWESRMVAPEFSVEDAVVQWSCVRLANVNAQGVPDPVIPFACPLRSEVVVARNR